MSTTKERIGILGGSFHPIHKGHLHLAQVAREAFELSRVILMPTYISPFKQQAADVVEGIHRLEMCRLAAEPFPWMSVSDYELQQKTVSYTVYTVEYLRKQYPDAELVLLLGSDTLLSFQKWHQWERILSMASLGCVAREPEQAAILETAAAELRQYGKILLCCHRVFSVSSTEIRELLKKKADCTCYLPENVVKYMVTHALYGLEEKKMEGMSLNETTMFAAKEVTIANMTTLLQQTLSEKRFQHCLAVAAETRRLALLYGLDADRAELAGLVHDICKEYPDAEQLALVQEGAEAFGVLQVELDAPKVWHGIAGAVLLSKKYGITDKEFLNAIRYHTIGRAGMSDLEKIVYLADMTAGRSYADVPMLQALSDVNLDLAMHQAVKCAIERLMEKGAVLPIYTVEAYNAYTTAVRMQCK